MTSLRQLLKRFPQFIDHSQLITWSKRMGEKNSTSNCATTWLLAIPHYIISNLRIQLSIGLNRGFYILRENYSGYNLVIKVLRKWMSDKIAKFSYFRNDCSWKIVLWNTSFSNYFLRTRLYRTSNFRCDAYKRRYSIYIFLDVNLSHAQHIWKMSKNFNFFFEPKTSKWHRSL